MPSTKWLNIMAHTILSLPHSARMSATYSESWQLAMRKVFFLGQKMAMGELGPKYERGQGMAEKQAGLHRKKVQLYQECINILLHTQKQARGPKHFGGLQNGTVCKSIFQTWGNGIGKNIIANLYTEEKSITRNWNLLSWLICRDMQQSYCKFVHREVFSANTEQLTNLLTVEHLRNITSVILCTLPRVQSQNEIITHGEG